MKAVVYEAFGGPVTIEDVPEPHPVHNGVVLKVLASGLCFSDWHGWMGHDKDIALPHVPGHEMAGEIVAVGAGVKNWDIGDRVTLPFVCGCGSCPVCSKGDPQVCPDQFQAGFTHWGSFAEYVGIHYADYNLIRLPDEIDNATAASLGCRFATSFRGLVQQGRLVQGESVAIFGCGGVGLSAIMIAVGMGAQVIAIDIKESALAKATDLGATHVINAALVTEVPELIKELTHGGVHITVDAIGQQKVVTKAFQSLCRRGRHIQIGLLPPEVSATPIPMDIVIGHELELLGSHGMAAHSYPGMIDMILKGILKPQILIDELISLEEIPMALTTMNEYPESGIRVAVM